MLRLGNIVQPQFPDLAGQGVSPPPKKLRGILTTTAGLFQSGLHHYTLKGRDRLLERIAVACGELSSGPDTKLCAPILGCTGVAIDNDVTEALEDPGKQYYLGVQWHPEADQRSRVIGSLVAAARTALA